MGIRHLKPGKFLPSPGVIEINLPGSSNPNSKDKPQEEPENQKPGKGENKMATPKKSKAKLSKNNTSGYKGVVAGRGGKWLAIIRIPAKGKEKAKTMKLGRFEATNEGKMQAAKRYDEEALKVFGPDAVLNFPRK